MVVRIPAGKTPYVHYNFVVAKPLVPTYIIWEAKYFPKTTHIEEERNERKTYKNLILIRRSNVDLKDVVYVYIL